MPRINSALHLKGQKLPTHDKKKRQDVFDHDPDVLTAHKIRTFAKAFADDSPKPILVVLHPEWAKGWTSYDEEDFSDDPNLPSHSGEVL